MSTLEAQALQAPIRVAFSTALAGLALLCLPGCTPLLIDQQDHGQAVQKALEAQQLSPPSRSPASAPAQPAASELMPAYDRHLRPLPASSLTPQLP